MNEVRTTHPLAELMTLAAAYRAEDPAHDSASLEKLAMRLSHFFMALLPGAPGETIYVLTSLCVTQMGKERLQQTAGKPRAGGKA